MARRLSRAGSTVYASAVQAWLTGATPSADKLTLIADEFGVSTDWLLGRTEDRRPPDATTAQVTLRAVREVLRLSDRPELLARVLEALEAARHVLDAEHP